MSDVNLSEVDYQPQRISGELSMRSANEERENQAFLDLHKICLPLFGNDWNAHANAFLKRQSLSRILYYNELYQKIIDVPGVICELGCLYGATLSLLINLRGIYEPYNYTREIIGFDTFSGFTEVDKKDGGYSKSGDFAAADGYYPLLKKIIAYHEQQAPLNHIRKSELIAGDVSFTFPKWLENNQHAVISMIIFDMDVYKPTKKALEAVKPRLTKGSVLVFDEFSTKHFPGETVAIDEVLGLNNLRFYREPNAPTCSWAIYGESKL